MDAIHPIAAVALSKCITDNELKKLKRKILVGTNAGFDVTAKLTGRLTRAPGMTAMASVSILSHAVVCEAIRRLGVDRVKFEKTLLAVAKEAFLKGVPLKDQLLENDPELYGVIETVKKKIVAKLPGVMKSGAFKVQTDLKVTKCKIDLAE